MKIWLQKGFKISGGFLATSKISQASQLSMSKMAVLTTKKISLKLSKKMQILFICTLILYYKYQREFCKTKLGRLEGLNMLRINNNPPWTAGCFLQPKKDKTFRFSQNSGRRMYIQIRTSFPRHLQIYRVLNIGYYTIYLDADS